MKTAALTGGMCVRVCASIRLVWIALCVKQRGKPWLTLAFPANTLSSNSTFSLSLSPSHTHRHTLTTALQLTTTPASASLTSTARNKSDKLKKKRKARMRQTEGERGQSKNADHCLQAFLSLSLLLGLLSSKLQTRTSVESARRERQRKWRMTKWKRTLRIWKWIKEGCLLRGFG